MPVPNFLDKKEKECLEESAPRLQNILQLMLNEVVPQLPSENRLPVKAYIADCLKLIDTLQELKTEDVTGSLLGIITVMVKRPHKVEELAKSIREVLNSVDPIEKVLNALSTSDKDQLLKSIKERR